MSTFKTIIEAEVLVAFPAAPAAITGDMTLRDLIRLILHLMHSFSTTCTWHARTPFGPTTVHIPTQQRQDIQETFRRSMPMRQQQTLRMGERHGNGSSRPTPIQVQWTEHWYIGFYPSSPKTKGRSMRIGSSVTLMRPISSA